MGPSIMAPSAAILAIEVGAVARMAAAITRDRRWLRDAAPVVGSADST